MTDNRVAASKFLSLVLRHRPESIGLSLDANGWADIDQLLRPASRKGKGFTRGLIEEIVATNDKKRFIISEDGARIRASQGHSIDIDLGLSPTQPPAVLFHGTATGRLDSIRALGLIKGKRQYVHLSGDEATAVKVGQRHGQPVVIRVAGERMDRDGYLFYLSANAVWLTHHVLPEYLEFPT